jgi:hypothetical protein
MFSDQAVPLGKLIGTLSGIGRSVLQEGIVSGLNGVLDIFGGSICTSGPRLSGAGVWGLLGRKSLKILGLGRIPMISNRLPDFASTHSPLT